ncbi:MAG: hypothetical protein Q8S73_43725 [Deltaproteobacteria bacterium]|nr:hypothetical protein [Deltaproteobacteria bacterium]
MLSRNFRFVEALGMLLVLLAWVASSNSVQTWTDARDSHQKQIAFLVDAYQHAQITANLQLEAAIGREVLRQQPNDGGPETASLYQRTWHSPDVRRAWLQRLTNSTTGLTLVHEAMALLNNQHDLIPKAKIRSFAVALAALNHRIQRLIPSDQHGWISTPTFDEGALSPQEANEIEQRLMRVTEGTLVASDDITQAISNRRTRSWRVYAAIFLLGTALLISAKLLNWRIDIKASSTATKPVPTTGDLKARQDILLRVLGHRTIVLTEDDRARILACSETEVLDRWLDRAMDAKTLTEIFL